jgi:predicted acyltransferase
MVNNQSGGAFAAMRHKSWDGCTPTDLVFPFFLFIVGVSLWFSYRKTGHQLTGAAVWRLFRRGALIFAVGLFLNWFPFYDFRAGEWRGFETLRIMGVLQRIGLAFFVGGVIALWLGSYRRIAVTAGVILVGYWLGVELAGDATREGFIGNRIDAFLLGVDHLHRPDSSFDPEGIFSTIPAIATVLLGYMTGKFVGENRQDRVKTLGTLGMAGGLLIVAALAFNTICPINKPIWSSTFVLYTAGLAMMMWMAMLWFFDYRGKRFGTIFGATFGTNALFAYVLAWILMSVQRFPFFTFEIGETRYSAYSWLASRIAGVTTPQWGALIASFVLVGVIWSIVYPLYRKRIFIRL